MLYINLLTLGVYVFFQNIDNKLIKCLLQLLKFLNCYLSFCLNFCCCLSCFSCYLTLLVTVFFYAMYYGGEGDHGTIVPVKHFFWREALTYLLTFGTVSGSRTTPGIGWWPRGTTWGGTSEKWEGHPALCVRKTEWVYNF